MGAEASIQSAAHGEAQRRRAFSRAVQTGSETAQLGTRPHRIGSDGTCNRTMP